MSRTSDTFRDRQRYERITGERTAPFSIAYALANHPRQETASEHEIAMFATQGAVCNHEYVIRRHTAALATDAAPGPLANIAPASERRRWMQRRMRRPVRWLRDHLPALLVLALVAWFVARFPIVQG